MDLSTIQPLLDWLYSHQAWVAFAIVLIAFLESLALAGVVIPGVLLLFGASAVAGSGILTLWQALACAFIGAVLGDGVSFFLGKLLKQRIKFIWPFRRYPEWIDNGESFFAQHGGKSVVIGRFVGPIRPVIPLIAGMLDMPSRHFILVNLASAVAWAPTYAVPGFLFGASTQLQLPPETKQLLLYLGLIAALGFILIRLSHWQLSPESPLYRALRNWARRQRHVRLFWYWLAERGRGRRTFPLSGIVLLTVTLTGFLLTLYWVEKGAALHALNRQVFDFFATLQHPWLDYFFALISRLGDSAHTLLVAGIMVLWLLYKRYFWAVFISVATLTLMEGVVQLMQQSPALTSPLATADGRTPPPAHLLSAHTARATLLFGLLVSFIAQELPHRRRWWLYGTALVPMLLVAVSRLYLNQHWLTAIISSLLLGLGLCALSQLIFRRFNRHRLTADISLWVALSAAITASVFYVMGQHGLPGTAG